MKKIRISASVIIKDNLAVQSFFFKNYLPIGKPEIVIENLDRWNVDEIIVLDIDRSKQNTGPNLRLIEKIAQLQIKTPLIYGGGIRNIEDAKNVIKKGADRLIIGFNFFRNFNIAKNISSAIGAQAVIISMPFIKYENEIYIFDYIKKKKIKINKEILNYLNSDYVSEIFLSDVNNDGKFNGFKYNIIQKLKKFTKSFPIIVYGGISHKKQLNDISSHSNVSAITIGNFLNYSELSYKNYFKGLIKKRFRVPSIY